MCLGVRVSRYASLKGLACVMVVLLVSDKV